LESGEFQNLPPFPLRRVGHPELQTDFKRTAGNYFAAFSACAVSLIAGVIRKAGPPAQCTLLRPNFGLRRVNAIAPKLVSRPVEFCLPLCHATNGEFSNDACDETCGGPASFRGQLASPLKSAGSEQKASLNCRSEKHRIPSDHREPKELSSGLNATPRTQRWEQGEEKALAAAAANRNTCQFRNRPNPLTNLEHSVF